MGSTVWFSLRLYHVSSRKRRHESTLGGLGIAVLTQYGALFFGIDAAVVA